jgi:hypothetical protein
MKRTYGVLLDAAVRAALLTLAVKVFSVVVIANLEGATVELRTFATVLPYLSVSAAPSAFLEISTYSTLAMALVAMVYLIPAVIRPAFPSPRTWGRILGVIVAAETLTIQIILHYLGMSNIRTDRVWWIVMVLLAGLLLGSAGLGFTPRAPVADPDHQSIPHPTESLARAA